MHLMLVNPLTLLVYQHGMIPTSLCSSRLCVQCQQRFESFLRQTMFQRTRCDGRQSIDGIWCDQQLYVSLSGRGRAYSFKNPLLIIPPQTKTFARFFLLTLLTDFSVFQI
jgi:hypothetical protein